MKGENGQIITKRCPFWISYVDGEFVLNEHAEALKRATELCFEMGARTTAQELNKLNFSKKYTESIIGKVLRQPAIYGSFIAMEWDDLGKPVQIKKEIKNYYPAVISESDFHRIGAKLSQRQDPKLAGRKAAEFKNILRGLVFCACGSGFRYHAQKSQYVDLVCSASLAGRCSYAEPGKGVRYRYARIGEIFLAYQSLIPFHQIIAKSSDIKALEKEHEELTGLLIQKEQALASSFAILEKASETAQKYVLSRIEEVSEELDQLKAKQHEVGLRISSMHLATKSEISVMDIYKLLLTESGRIKINNFLVSQAVRLSITPLKKKFFIIDIYLSGNHIDRINVTPDGYTAENKVRL